MSDKRLRPISMSGTNLEDVLRAAMKIPVSPPAPKQKVAKKKASKKATKKK